MCLKYLPEIISNKNKPPNSLYILRLQRIKKEPETRNIPDISNELKKE